MADDLEQIRQRIDADPDFIALKRYGNSLESFLEKYPNGVPDDDKGVKLIAQALCMTEEEVRETVEKVVKAIRRAMKVRV
jgi:hypothetical protein